MDSTTSARLLWSAVGGVFAVGLLRVILPDPAGLGKALLQAVLLVVVSLVIYRVLTRKFAE
jgi:hypothetical protein